MCFKFPFHFDILFHYAKRHLSTQPSDTDICKEINDLEAFKPGLA